MKLSVVIITYNEEKNIERCLRSVQSVADEIVVIDSMSTDATENICKQFNTKFIKQPFLGYTEQKNFALKNACFDYALSLDADEALSEPLQQSILDEKRKGFQHNAYKMHRCTNFCGKWIRHGTWYPDTKTRLINREKGRWAGLNVHEKIEIDEDARPYLLKGDLLHYSYYSLEEVITQNNKFTTIQAKAMFAQGRKSNWVKLTVNPFVAFVSGYIFKKGFLDGADGFFIASSVAYQTMVKYAKLLKLQRAVTK